MFLSNYYVRMHEYVRPNCNLPPKIHQCQTLPRSILSKSQSRPTQPRQIESTSAILLLLRCNVAERGASSSALASCIAPKDFQYGNLPIQAGGSRIIELFGVVEKWRQEQQQEEQQAAISWLAPDSEQCGCHCLHRFDLGTRPFLLCHCPTDHSTCHIEETNRTGWCSSR